MKECITCKHRNKYFNSCRFNKISKMPIPCELIQKCDHYESLENNPKSKKENTK